MKMTSFKTFCISSALTFFSLLSYSQEGNVIVNQDPEISNLLKLKKEINEEDVDSNRYKISIFSGSRNRAENIQNGYDNVFNSWPSKLVYETPNYKIYVGNFRSRLDAERALMEVKKKFPNAFIFKPKKK